MTVYAALERLRHIGNQMSNVCFNGKQKDAIPEDFRESMAELQEQWDAAHLAYSQARRERAADLRRRREDRGAKPRLKRRRVA